MILKSLKICLVFFLIFFEFTLSASNNTFYFKKIKVEHQCLTLSGTNIFSCAFLNSQYIIALGNKNQKIKTDFGQKLFLIEKKSRLILFESESEEIPYGSFIYSLRIANTIFVLWEKLGEYYSELSLYSLNDKTFRYIGDFNVFLNDDRYNEDLSYPVNKIQVVVYKDIIEFVFTEKTVLIKNGISKMNNEPLKFYFNNKTNNFLVK